MSALTPAVGESFVGGRQAPRLTFGGVVASEWIKVRTVRSTWWTLGATVVVMVGIGWAVAASMNALGSQAGGLIGGELPDIRAIAAVVGTTFGQLTVAIFGAMAMTGEYSTGSIRSTYSAVPRRTPVIAAKALIVCAVSAVTAVVSVALSYLVGLPYMKDFAAAGSITAEGWRMLGGTVLFLATLAVFAVGVGAIVRNSTGTIFLLVAVIFVLPLAVQIAGAISQARWLLTVGQLLPAAAGGQLIDMQMITYLDGTTLLSPWQGYGVLVVWTVVAVAAGIVLTKRRDV